MDIVQKAREFAKKCHEGQVRKYTGEPYFVHCADVAKIVGLSGGDENMQAAAYLHDVVEDTGVKIEVILEMFGVDVAQMVDDLTDVSKPWDGNREHRKKLDRHHTSMASPRAKTVKLADLISNSKDIAANDPNFAKVYMAEKKALLEVLYEGDSVLHAIATAIVNEYFRDKSC